MNKSLLISSAVVACISFSCSSSSEEESLDVTIPSKTDLSSIDLVDELDIDSGEAKMFTMPTPLQMASALKVMDTNYESHLLLDDKLSLSNDDIDLSMALGIYMVDMGYSTVYGNTQKSLDYATVIQSIMEELPISYYVNDVFRKRFKANINNHDSLCKITLQGFNDANQYMAENGNEGIGLLILTGAYVEGFYIVANSKVSNRWNPEFTNVLIQQKLFLDNFLTLLKPYQIDPEIKAVYEMLQDLSQVFQGLDISYDDQSESYKLGESLSNVKREEIREKISDLRTSLVTQIGL